MPDEPAPTIFTIGHSTRTSEELTDCLLAYGIELLVDIRRFPGSRRLPQFETGALEQHLGANGIAYRWLAALGGRRRAASAAETESAWRHPAFRAYAEHVETEEFAEGLFELTMLAGGLGTAIMCAEVLWWRCHRRLVADVLVASGFPVVHIFTPAKAESHVIRAPGRIVAGALTYSA